MKTNRDDWVYNFDAEQLKENVKRTIDTYNEYVERWANRKRRNIPVDEFVNYEDTKLKWSRDLKQDLLNGVKARFSENKIRPAIYRPFTKRFLFLDRVMNEEVYRQPEFFPPGNKEGRNLALWVKVGSEIPFWILAIDRIPDLMPSGGTQCFPYYTCDGGGAYRENIPDSTLLRFQENYADKRISKWDIFHYVYALLHHPEYRTRYAANIRRELPRIPMVGGTSGVLRSYVEIGSQLTNLHVNYERAAEYPLQRIENSDEKLNWRVEKMRLIKDKTALVYNDFLTLAGIPEAAFGYRLGNRSALEWVIDQYQTSIDPRSGITDDPNREDEPDYIIKLVGRVITVSLETQKLIARLPKLSGETLMHRGQNAIGPVISV